MAITEAKKDIRVAIIGCGAIGRKRAAQLATAKLVSCADVIAERAQALAKTVPGATAESTWQTAVSRKDVDVVIVSTTNDQLSEISLAAINAGKHVLVEKPAARSLDELDRMIQAKEKNKVLVRVGFNHRYHPAMQKAFELFKAGELGEMMFVRGRYGHGGRVGYDKEWRASKAVSGGGELIDQGVHLIDLARRFLGDFTQVQGMARTFYWDMEVDDNAFMLLNTADQKTAMLHVSCTEWKNLFSLEIYGKKAKLHIEGLGGSYGTERLTFYKMLPQMGPPETTTWEYPVPDLSWQSEFSEFLKDIRLAREPAASLYDARAVLDVVRRVYQA